MNRQFVIRTLAAACDTDPSRIGLATPTAELGLDSFALFWFISQVEAALAAELSAEQVMAIFRAQAVCDLAAAVGCAEQGS